MNPLITGFTTFLKAEGRSDNTINTYIVAVKQFLSVHDNKPGKITQTTIDRFFAGFNSRNQTQNLKKNAINKFLAFLYARKHIKEPYKARIKGRAAAEPEYLSKAEQDRFFAALQSNPKQIRDYTLFATMLYTGMRLNELINIRAKDIRDDHIRLRDSKTGAGKVYIREKLKSLLDDYLAGLSPPPGREDYIFLSRNKRRISARMVQLLIKKYLHLANIKKDLSPHALRHTFAARLRQSGSDIEIIQRTLRHKHIQSTTRYGHIEDEDLKKAVERSVKIRRER